MTFHSMAEKTFRFRPALRVLAVLPLLIGLAIAFGVYSNGNGVVAGCIAGATAGLFALCWKAASTPFLEVHPEGLYYRGAFTEKSIGWDEITETRYWQQLQAQAVGAHFGLIGAIMALRAAKNPNAKVSSRSLTVIAPNAKIRVSSNFANVNEIIDIIFAKVNPRIKDAAKKAIDSGTTASFGNVKLSSQGVIWKNKEPIPYSRISKAGIEGQAFKIKAEGKWLDLVSTISNRVPNIFVLMELIEDMKAPAAAGPVPVPAGTTSETRFGFR